MLTPAASTLPSPAVVGSLLTGIIGRSVTANDDIVVDLSSPGVSYCGVYRDDLGAAHFACVFDLAFAAYAGAALLLLPPARARSSVEAGRLEPMIEENVLEILKTQARIFGGSANRHVHLSEVLGRTGRLPDRLCRLLPARLDRVDFEADIQGYGGGRMSILRLADPLTRIEDDLSISL